MSKEKVKLGERNLITLEIFLEVKGRELKRNDKKIIIQYYLELNQSSFLKPLARLQLT